MVANAPKLEYRYHYDAFNELSSERHYAMGPAPIPVSIIEAYARRDELTRIETDIFVYVIRCLDHYFLKQIADRNKAAG
ncbi:phage tail assembly chaperone [Sphingomonas sp. Leaf34]|uniref:phage tail assembly chaperone n=1 Tax=Sphingomonas sp. Leaf34 TaxID=1736216 RepID=UPI003FA7B6E8